MTCIEREVIKEVPVETIKYVQIAHDADRQEEEAYERISAYLEHRDIHFNRASPALADIEQAWSVHHLDPVESAQNRETLRGVAAILGEYDDMRVYVVGSSGHAHTAPTALAKYLRTSVTDVPECMEALARFRAEAVIEALVTEHGVPREQVCPAACHQR